MGKHIKLSTDDQIKVEAFIRRKHAEKGDAFDDAMVAADAAIENLIPGQELSGEFIKKVRKQIGIKLPRGNRFTAKKKAGRPKKNGPVIMGVEVPSGDANLLQLAIDRLREKKLKIDALILKLEDAILVANGL